MNPAAIIFLLVVGFIACYAVYAFLLRFLWWQVFGRSGMRGLFVYTSNPKWAEYIERTILPLLPNHVLVINLSSLRSLSAESVLVRRIHRHWTGEKDHTPAAIVFSSFWRVRSLKLYRPILKAVRGNAVTLDRQLQSLRALLGEAGRAL